MDTLYITIGAMVVPFGLVVALTALEHENSLGWTILGILAVVAALLGLALCLITVLSAKKKATLEEKRQELRELASICYMQLFEQAVSELKGLREDMKGGEDKNGGSKND